ncbi:MAG TPA: isochorismatase family protein [Candidatus Sulfotelmatobacter sp.]|jgi:nicotinamidase-related amidase
MPLTKLDAVPALIVIDLQKGIIALPTVHPIGEIISRVAQLARAFRERNLPVVLVNVRGVAPGRTEIERPNLSRPDDWSDLVAELEKHSGDYLVTKETWGAFLGTTMDDYLRRRGVTQVFLVGVSTSVGVESTARSAYDLGYNVVMVVDAMTDRNMDAHRHSVEKIFPRLSETATTEDVLKFLKDAAAQ